MREAMRLKFDVEAGGVALLRLHNPPRRTMDGATEAELEAALDTIENTDRLRVAILTGAEQAVSIRHYDVHVLEERARKKLRQHSRSNSRWWKCVAATTAALSRPSAAGGRTPC